MYHAVDVHASSVKEKKLSNPILTDFHGAINECEDSLCAAVVPYFLSRACEVCTLAMLSNTAANFGFWSV